MKKIFLLLAAVGMIFTACEGGLDNEENGGNPATPKIELSQQNIEVGFKPAQYSVNITSPYSWEATSKNDWIVVDTKSGIAGTKELKFSVKRNEESEIREGTIAIKNEDYNTVTELYITQKQPEFTRIFYTSSNGNIVKPNATNVFGARIVSNTYENGKGIITFDAPVTSIGERAFSRCTSLTSVTIPDSVTSIGEGAFFECTSLTSVTIPDSVTSIGSMAFYRCCSLTSITIPDSVTEIGSEVFFRCCSLTSVTIPDSVTLIGGMAFYHCCSLTSVTIPDSITKIGTEAFSGCTSLTSVIIGNSVTSIGYYAFSGCTSLTEVYCKPTTPPTGNSNIFNYNASGFKIYVPRNSVSAYKAATYWSDYADYIVGYNFE